jgi:NAD(P)H-nitrite reductase large subunit
VILGGGLIGAAATAALLERGVELTIIELAPRILSSVLDEDASSLIQSILDARGVRTITGHTISRVDGDRLGPRSTLDSGEVIDSDLLVVAIGVRPRTELAMDAGIEVDRGIIVNRKMETSAPGVYAAGDCAQVYDSLREKNMVLALWPTAYMGGRVAGRNMAGGNAQLEWSTSMNSMNYFGTSVLSAGIVNAPEGGGWDEIIERKEEGYRKIVTRGGVIKGFVLVDDVEKAGIYLQMMRGKTDIGRLSKSPLAEDFGLIHLPTMERRRILKEAVRIAGH